MKVKINGQLRDFESPLTLYDILEQEDVIEMMIAVAQNSQVVPRSRWEATHVSDGDEIEIVAPMQGG